jgi:hypothetical protein
MREDEDMEVSTIRQYAEKNFSEAAVAAENRRRLAWQEIPEIKRERRIHQQATLAKAIVAAVTRDRRKDHLREMQSEALRERQLGERLRQKARQTRYLERRLRTAINRAQIFTGLMRRARDGDTYAPHQADTLARPQVTLYL